MAESIRERYGRWRLEELLLRYPGLRIVPSDGVGLTLAGDLAFRVKGPSQELIEDSYAVELHIPASFPHIVAMAKETGGRIAKTFHKLEGDFLCLAAPTQLRLELSLAPTLVRFVEGFVIPYLFSHSLFFKQG